MTNQRVRAEWYHERVGRGYMVQVWEAENPEDMGPVRQYDIELAYGGRMVTKLSKNCCGSKSAEFWYSYHVKIMKRLMMLLDNHDIAYKNMLACSKSNTGREPKDGCEDRWKEEKEKFNMMRDWIDDIMRYNGEETYIILKKEMMSQLFDMWADAISNMKM